MTFSQNIADSLPTGTPAITQESSVEGNIEQENEVSKQLQDNIVALGPNGEIVSIFPNGDYFAQNISSDLKDALDDFLKVKQTPIRDLEFSPTSGWAILTTESFRSEGITPRFKQAMISLIKAGEIPVDVNFFPLQWTDKRGFAITTKSGIVVLDGIEEIITGQKPRNPQTILSEQGIKQLKAVPKARYRFAFNQLVAEAIADGEQSPDVLEIYGAGQISLAIKHNDTGEEVVADKLILQRNPAGQLAHSNTIVLPEASPVNLPKKLPVVLSGSDYYFEIDPTEFGYRSIEDVEKNARLSIKFSLLEQDVSTADDQFPAQEITLPLVEYPELSVEEILSATRAKNVLEFREGDSIVLLSFSINKQKQKQ
ncbi:MAG: hypothetical protein KTR13_07285 [Saprospiraceae bacterium]|nr:hypothetical protein [Saprospiraceae bacterium]